MATHTVSKKNYDAALADYSQAITLDPKRVDAYVNRGNTYRDLQKFQQAVTDYTQAINLDPKLVDAYVNRGAIYYRHLQKFQLALDDLDKALAIDSSNVIAYQNRGLVYEGSSRLDLARADYERGLKLSPDDPWLRAALQRVSAKRNK